MHLFISYAKKDTRELALALTDALNALEGITAWVDKTLRAGKSWEIQIQSEIDRCDTMIVLYSPDINRHKFGQDESYVLTEIGYAKYTAKKPIIPVMAVQTAPPISLTTVHYIDFTIDGLTLTDLVDALCGELGIAAVLLSQPPAVDVPKAPQRSAPTPSTPPPAPRRSDPVQEALERARAFTGKRNRDWTPFLVTFNDLKIPDMPFCLVPVGSFQMGEGKEAPPQSIIQPYYIAQYPVTNAQWAMGVKAGVVKEPGSGLHWYRDAAMVDAPVVGVSWLEVKKFVDWLGCRLPTEPEWEYAARGVESLVYPWGNEWQPDWCVHRGNSGGKPASVSSKPEGASWIGSRHLSGNVYDWVSSQYQPYPYKVDDGREDVNRINVLRVLRGGAWNYDYYFVRAATRNGNVDSIEFPIVGFRCARSLE